MSDIPIDAGGQSPGGASPPVAEPPVTPGQSAPAWHEGLITKDAAGVESLADPATWLSKAPKPLADFIGQQMAGARQKTEGMFKVPTAESPPEEWEGVYKALGRPEKPEDYKIEKPEKLPDGVDWDDAAVKRFAPVAHALGLTPSQVAKLSEYQIGEVGATVAATRAAMADQIKVEGEMLKKYFPGENGLSDAARIAQAEAGKHGIPAAAFDPSSGEFWGPEAMKLFVSMIRKNDKLTGEASVTGHQGQAVVKGGYEWAADVMRNPNNPDYSRYRGPKADAKFQKEVNDAMATAPKDWVMS